MKRFFRALSRYWDFILIFIAVTLFIAAGVDKGITSGQDGETMYTIGLYKKIDGGIKSFKERYGYLPGDLPNPKGVLEGCAKLDCVSGNGDGIVGQNDPDLSSLGFDLTSENEQFWLHLQAAGLIETGGRHPAIGGKLGVFSHSEETQLPFTLEDTKARGGLYLLHSGTGQLDVNQPAISPSKAAIFDRKRDDGIASSGSFLGAGRKECFDLKQPSFYNETYAGHAQKKWWGGGETDRRCIILYLRIHG